jgi:hypothetical protein
MLVEDMHKACLQIGPSSDEGRDLIAKIMKQPFVSAPTSRDVDVAKEEREVREHRHEVLRDAIEDALRSTIEKTDKYLRRHPHEH